MSTLTRGRKPRPVQITVAWEELLQQATTSPASTLNQLSAICVANRWFDLLQDFETLRKHRGWQYLRQSTVIPRVIEYYAELESKQQAEPAEPLTPRELHGCYHSTLLELLNAVTSHI